MTELPEEPKGSSENSEKGFALETTGVHFTEKGTLLSGKIHSHNMDIQEVHDVMVDATGADPEDIRLRDNDGKTVGGRNMARAAFGNWNSSWIAEADRKKKDNAHLN